MLLARILERLRPQRDDNLSILTHAMHLFGPELPVEREGGEPVRLVDVILDGTVAREFFGASGHLVETRYGVRVPLWERSLVGTNQQGTEAHPGQTLSVLAEEAVPLDSAICLADGDRVQLHNILDDLIANFTLQGEVYWDAVALALYLPPKSRWKNKFGEDFTFDDVARELLRRPLDDSSCAGTHRLLDLAILQRVDLESQVLSPDAKRQVSQYLQDMRHRILRLQRPEGYWELIWYTELAEGPAVRDRVELHGVGRLIATGHLVEWLLLFPADSGLSEQALARAGNWLLNTLRARCDDDGFFEAHYCPVSHAARALLLLSKLEPEASQDDRITVRRIERDSWSNYRRMGEKK